MTQTVGLARAAVESEIDRYCVWPAQACGYKIGHLEFLRLREAAGAKLGPRFELRSFHDAVLKGGAMPLEVLAQVVDDWASTLMAGDVAVADGYFLRAGVLRTARFALRRAVLAFGADWAALPVTLW